MRIRGKSRGGFFVRITRVRVCETFVWKLFRLVNRGRLEKSIKNGNCTTFYYIKRFLFPLKT